MRTLGIASAAFNTSQEPAGYAFYDGFSSGITKWSSARARSGGDHFSNPAGVGYCMDFTPAFLDNVAPPNDVVTYNGQLWMGNGSQNYGDTMMRCNQPFDMTTTNTIEFDTHLQQNPAGLIGWRHIVFSSLPYSCPSAKANNSHGPTPQYGFGVRLDKNVNDNGYGTPYPEAFVWNNYAETIIEDTGNRTMSITIGPPLLVVPYAMTAVKIQWTASNVKCYANGVLWFDEDWTLPTQITTGTGWFYLGCHNHASIKYSEPPAPAPIYSTFAVYDNVRLNGTKLAAPKVIVVPDNVQPLVDTDEVILDGVTIGWQLPDTVTISGVPDPATLGSARLICHMTIDANRADASSRMTWALNGGTVHTEVFPEWASGWDVAGGIIWSLPLNLSELVTGNNTVAFTTNVPGYPDAVYNVQLMYELAFFTDHFTGTSIDTTKWDVYSRLPDMGNNELNCCTTLNVTVASSIMRITAVHADSTCGDTTTGAPNPRTMNYTSGHVAQKVGSLFLYGTVDVRAKLNGGLGIWPCIWMLGYGWQPNQPYTANDVAALAGPPNALAEIDIAEFMNGTRTQVNCQIHWNPRTDGPGSGLVNPGGQVTFPAGFNANSGFAVYRLVWTPGSALFYADYEDGNGFRLLQSVTSAPGVLVPDVPMYFTINMPVGGAGGDPSGATFPVYMEVDYVRITKLT